MLIKKLLISAITATLLSTQLFALPPQVEADRLGLAAKTAMEVKDYKTAVEKLEGMQKLGVKLPDTFNYHYGTALLETGKYGEALKMFDSYLAQGQGAKFYKEALEKYNQADNTLNKIQEKLKLHQENMNNCWKEYYTYRDSLQQDMERWSTRCGNFLKYGCRDYHQGDSDDRNARVIERAMEAATERYYQISNQSDWCRTRYPE